MVLIQYYKPSRGPTQTPPQATPAQSSPLPRGTTSKNLAPSHGTLLSNIQLSTLTNPQLKTLAKLVSTRGVVFLRDQHLTLEVQSRISDYLSSDPPINKPEEDIIPTTETGSNVENFVDEDEDDEEWHTDKVPTHNTSLTSSFTIFNASSLDNEKGSRRTAWVSLYGLYESLSTPMRALIDGLHVDAGQVKGEKGYVPLFVKHPDTGVKALNVEVLKSGGGKIRELKKKEGGTILNFLAQHTNSSHIETLHWTWRAHDVAIWDNRAVAYQQLVPSPSTTSSNHQTHFSVVRGTKTVSTAPSHSNTLKPTPPPPTPSKPKKSQPQYNNTPSRRIIHHQLSFLLTPTIPSSHPSEPTLHPHPERADSLSPTSSPLLPSSSTSSSPLKIGKQQTSSTSPLRRIVERQVSARRDDDGKTRGLDFSKWGGRRVGVYS